MCVLLVMCEESGGQTMIRIETNFAKRQREEERRKKSDYTLIDNARVLIIMIIECITITMSEHFIQRNLQSILFNIMTFFLIFSRFLSFTFNLLCTSIYYSTIKSRHTEAKSTVSHISARVHVETREEKLIVRMIVYLLLNRRSKMLNSYQRC